jgi:hypothetical protein
MPMEVFVNGEKLDLQLGTETVFGQVFDGLNNWALTGRKRIWSMKIDDTQYDMNEDSVFRGLAIAGIKRVDLSLGEVDPAREIRRRLDAIVQGFRDADTLVDTLAQNLHVGTTEATHSAWQRLLGILNNFNKVYPFVADIYTRGSNTTLEPEYQKFKSVLGELLKSRELEDSVSFGDQLTYELQPLLKEWTERIIETKKYVKKGI